MVQWYQFPNTIYRLLASGSPTGHVLVSILATYIKVVKGTLCDMMSVGLGESLCLCPMTIFTPAHEF